MEARSSGRDGVLERSLDLLECFTAEEPILSASQIARRTGLAVSSVHRLLAKLLTTGFVEKVQPHGYAVGMRLWKVGELSPVQLQLRETAGPLMLRLYEATGENIQLAVLDGRAPRTTRVLYIGRVAGLTSSPTLTRVGGSFPLHTTGVGKALLARQDPEWLDDYIEGGLLSETKFSITARDDLLRDLDMVRARGYAVTREEMTLGTASAAVAFDAVAHLPAAAIGVVTEARRFRERELSAMVMAAGQQLRSLLSEQFDD